MYFITIRKKLFNCIIKIIEFMGKMELGHNTQKFCQLHIFKNM